jgi:hypothetical protein
MPNRKVKDKTPVPVIYFDNGVGGTLTIKAPVLLSIFQSEELVKAYREDPDRRYSVKEIYDLCNKNIPVKEATIRRALTDNGVFFETGKDIDIRKHKGKKTVVVINFTKLKPIAEYVFDAVQELWEDE